MQATCIAHSSYEDSPDYISTQISIFVNGQTDGMYAGGDEVLETASKIIDVGSYVTHKNLEFPAGFFKIFN